MKPAPFVHHAPRTVEEAVAVLAEVGHDGKVLAGGQSLIPILNMRLASPAHLVDINRVAGLDAVTVSRRRVRVGALVRHAGWSAHEEAYAALPLLRQALVNVAHPAIRNRGTTVGSIAHADAAGEMPAILALTDGVVEAAATAGPREIACAATSSSAPLETSLAAEELAVAVRFGRFAAGTGTAFAEPARRHGDYAMAGVGAAVTAGRRRRLRRPRVVRLRHRRPLRRSTSTGVLGGASRDGRVATGVDAAAEAVRGARRAGGRHPRHRRLPPDARRAS